MKLSNIIDLAAHPIGDPDYRDACKAAFDRDGVLVMPGFVQAPAVNAIGAEGEANRARVYARTERHTVYLSPPDPAFAPDHPRNRLVTSSKGCITDDLMPADSALRTLYDSNDFQGFLCHVLGEAALFPYADPLSSINLHFAERGQELGWHFDNSSFAITLMVQAPEQGGAFEYVSNLRDADAGEMSFAAVGAVLDGAVPVNRVTVDAGTLMFFRGRNSIHRVAPNLSNRTRMLAVLAYNTEPGVSLSRAARMTFYGRTG